MNNNLSLQALEYGGMRLLAAGFTTVGVIGIVWLLLTGIVIT